MSEFTDKLREVINDWKYRLSTYTVGGCETCGYGGDEVYDLSERDIERLEADIDEFCKSFEKDK